MIDLDGIQVAGYSVGGFASCTDFPELKVTVDLGICLERVVARDHVLITHAHVDHLGALAQHAAQRGLLRLPPATYVVPPDIADDVAEILKPWRRLDRGELAATILTLPPGERLVLRRDLTVRPFRTRHRVVSQGYLIERQFSKLNPEYVGLDAQALKELRLDGTNLNVTEHEVLVAVTGDTVLSAVLEHEEVRTARRLIMECTFFDDRIDPEGARKRGHVHLDEVAHALQTGQLAPGALLLNHVSPRHSAEAARALLGHALPPDWLGRTSLMVGHAN